MALNTTKLKLEVITSQTGQIKECIRTIYNTKKLMIEKLEEAKWKIRKCYGLEFSKCHLANISNRLPSVFLKDKVRLKTDRNMATVDEISVLMDEIKKEFCDSQSLVSNLKIVDAEFKIPEDISQIQSLHDDLIQDLDSLRNVLEKHLSVIEKTELIMNILNYKAYEIRYDFRTRLDQLVDKKDAVTKQSVTEQEDSQIALQIVHIDDEISELEEDHQNEMESLKSQKIDAQKEYEYAVQVMDENFEKMCQGFNKLQILIEAEKSTAEESESQLIDERVEPEIDRIKTDIEKYTELQTTGWKVLYPDEKISELLEKKGLKVSITGLLMTQEGYGLTFQEAKASRILEGLSPDVLDTLKENLVHSNEDDESSKSTSSITSKISTEDVNYLKEYLGKPLTLALAEITAVQPRDPIHYLGHWLFKYRYNQQIEDVNNLEFEALNEKRIQLAKERWHKFVEDEARAAVLDMIIHAEEIALMRELQRIQEESDALEEMENLEDEARDIFGNYDNPQIGKT